MHNPAYEAYSYSKVLVNYQIILHQMQLYIFIAGLHTLTYYTSVLRTGILLQHVGVHWVKTVHILIRLLLKAS